MGAPLNNNNAYKMSAEFVAAAEKILFDDINAIIYTDDEIVIQTNQLIDKKFRCHKSTFEKWKAKVTKNDELDELEELFYGLIKRALIHQKKILFSRFVDEPMQWQKWAWIIERKFDDWNMRQKTVDESVRPKQLVFRVLADGENLPE